MSEAGSVANSPDDEVRLRILADRIGLDGNVDLGSIPRHLWERPDLWGLSLEEIFPGLGQIRDWSPIIGSSVRTNNVLRRAKITDWKTLSTKTLGNLDAAPNLGKKVFEEILATCLNVWLNRPDPILTDDEQFDSDRGEVKAGPSKILAERVENGLSLLELMREVTSEYGSMNVEEAAHDLIQHEAWANGGQVWKRIREQGWDAFIGVEGPSESAWAELLDFGEEDLEIMRLRVFASGKKLTLSELGERRGVTRERIRQRETKIKAAIEARLKGRPSLVGIRVQAARLGRSAEQPVDPGQLRMLATDAVKTSSAVGADYELRTSVLMSLCPPLIEIEDRVTTLRTSDQLIALKSKVPITYPYLVPPEVEHSIQLRLDELKLPEEWLLKYLSLRRINSKLVYWSTSMNDHAVAVLEANERLMTMDEIHDQVGFERNPRSLGNSVQADSRIRRRGKELYGLDTWGGEEYEGIETELRQAVERAGGRVNLEETISRFVREFDVSENSVRSYASSRVFVRDPDGMLRFREAEDVSPDQNLSVVPGNVSDVVLINGIWHLRVRVDEDLLRGSGRPLKKAAAIVSGLEPDVVLGFEYEGGVIMFSWGGRSPSLGSLRNAAVANDCVEGDLLFVPLDGDEPRKCSVVRGRLLADSSGAERLALELGIDADVMSSDELLPNIAAALDLATGSDWPDVSSRLSDRRERDLLRWLPDESGW